MSVSLATGESTQRNVSLINAGDDDLVWSINQGSDWLSVSPEAGSVPGGGTSNLLLSFDATGLQEGAYYDTIRVTHNAPFQESPLDIPVTLMVTEGIPEHFRGGILSIGPSAFTEAAGARFRIVDMRIGSAVAGQVQGSGYSAVLK